MELPKRFNNRPSDFVKYEFVSPSTGVRVNQMYFVSRATAVVGVVFAYTDKGMQILIAKRSATMKDEPSKVGVPCGYLDWNETRHEAMMREVYEETSFHMPDYDDLRIYNNEGQPFWTKDDPKDNRQNVSHIYLSVFDFSKCMDRFPWEVENFSCKETAWVKWIDMETFFKTYTGISWAFNHDETIKRTIDFNNKVRIAG